MILYFIYRNMSSVSRLHLNMENIIVSKGIKIDTLNFEPKTSIIKYANEILIILKSSVDILIIV